MHRDRVAFVNPTRFILALLLAAAALALPSIASASAGANAEPTIPRGAPLTSWQENGHAGSYVLQLAQGRPLAPGARAVGVVLSDSDCAPDAQGLNHCHNVIELADGSRIVVTNTHVMARNRCLGNGDRLTLHALNASWMMGELGADARSACQPATGRGWRAPCKRHHGAGAPPGIVGPCRRAAHVRWGRCSWGSACWFPGWLLSRGRASPCRYPANLQPPVRASPHPAGAAVRPSAPPAKRPRPGPRRSMPFSRLRRSFA